MDSQQKNRTPGFCQSFICVWPSVSPCSSTSKFPLVKMGHVQFSVGVARTVGDSHLKNLHNLERVFEERGYKKFKNPPSVVMVEEFRLWS